MKFDIILPITFSKLENFEFEMYEEDSLIEALSIVENALDEFEGSKFYFNALNEIWNVTVFGDFSVFLEQLLKIISVIKEKNDSYILDFYEVGTNRKLLLKLIDKNFIKIENASINTWNNSNIDIVEKNILDNDIKNFVKKIRDSINIIAPEINTIGVLNSWYWEILGDNPLKEEPPKRPPGSFSVFD